MKILKILIPAAALLFAAQVSAQQQDAEEARRAAEERKAEMRLAEAEAREKMLQAERQLEEAARQIAELSSQNLPRVIEMEKSVIDLMGKPRLGVTIGGSDQDGPVEGVSILGVTPGSAAADAGLRAGDIITAVNSESLSADSIEEAQSRLLDFMRGVEEGDKLEVEYLRDGNVGKVEVEPRIVEGRAYAWFGDDTGSFSMPHVPDIHVAPNMVRKFQYVAPFFGNSWGDMELVELNEGLGRYFGTDTGLLVVNAPNSDAFKLQDGDVIMSIDDREPTSVGHAMRILSSYQPGESLELRIIRDKRRETLSIEMPDDRTSFVAPPAPPVAPRPAVVIRERLAPVHVHEDRT
jgi:C-terminal processing protease CtpA/Prc